MKRKELVCDARGRGQNKKGEEKELGPKELRRDQKEKTEKKTLALEYLGLSQKR